MTKPKYQIGDRIFNSNIFVRGIATLSNGKRRYFLQIFDNTLVIESDAVEELDLFARLMKIK